MNLRMSLSTGKGGPVGSAPLYQFVTTMTVGTAGGNRGYRVGKWGSGVGSGGFADGYTLNRVYLTGDATSASALFKFSADLQYGDVTSLWVQFGAQDFVEMVWNDAGAYAISPTADLAGLWSYLDSEVGNEINLIIEVR